MTSLDAALTRADAVRAIARALAANGIDAGDARFLVLDALSVTNTELLLGGAEPIGAENAHRLEAALARRLAGEPVARIGGAWEFWGLPFALAPATLVPRPDTETLVEAALAAIPDRARLWRLLDLGTGSGCILVALLTELPASFGIGLDRAYEAAATARANARANGVGDRMAVLTGNWCGALTGPFDLIVSNPPYIASAAIADLAAEVRLHDPLAALDGGPDGLDAYRAIVAAVAGRSDLLAPAGALVFEVGYDQAEAVARIGSEAGFAEVVTRRDLSGHARVVAFRGLRTRAGDQEN